MVGRGVVPEEVAINSAELCQFVYDFYEEPEATAAKVRDTLSVTDSDMKWFDIKGTDTQAVVLSKDQYVYLVFQGTLSQADVIADLTFELVPYEGGHCHRAFLKISQDTFDEISLEVNRRLSSQSYDGVVIAGHSLGGAIAMMYADLFVRRSQAFPLKYLVTFGQPRCGNLKFAKIFSAYNFKYVRFLNAGDCVPDVPPPYKSSNWSHAGEGYIFDQSKMREVTIADETSLWSRLLFLALRFVHVFLKKRKLDKGLLQDFASSLDHSMSCYRENLKKYFASLESN